MSTVHRWCSKEKSKVSVQCPNIVKFYNGGMFGVDLADMLISLYRISVKTKRWYIKIFWHMIYVAKVNSWLLYKRHCRQKGSPANRQLTLLRFTLQFSDALIAEAKSQESPKQPGRPPKRKSQDIAEPKKAGRKPFSPSPNYSSQKDQVGHWPQIRSTEKGRCRHCPSGYSRTHSLKCNVCLCLTVDKNCFLDFHK